MESSSSQRPNRPGGTQECGRPDLGQRLSAGEELSGGFGAELSAHAKSCPTCSLRLSLVQQAERWLADHASSNRATWTSSTPCPPAEELYDFGHGPGAAPINQGAESRIEAHLVDCEACRRLVATLVTRPPGLLLGDAPQALAPQAGGQRGPIALPQVASVPLTRRPAAERRWLPYAAAAALVLGGFYLWKATRVSRGADRANVETASIAFPKLPQLRGVTSGPLRFPRGDVLPSLSLGAAGTLLPLHFEIQAQAGASEYVMKLYRAGTAFERGPEIYKYNSAEPQFDLPADIAKTLVAGEYSWEAWAVVNKLPCPLEPQGFEILEDRAGSELFTKNLRLAEPARSTTILTWLVEHELLTDARAYALGLESSPDRDEFLRSIASR
ncbi:MAG: hypothetical protein ABI054_05225 [Planctomycetota bacterium]